MKVDYAFPGLPNIFKSLCDENEKARAHIEEQ